MRKHKVNERTAQNDAPNNGVRTMTYRFEFDDVRSLGLEHIKERYEEFEINKWSETKK